MNAVLPLLWVDLLTKSTAFLKLPFAARALEPTKGDKKFDIVLRLEREFPVASLGSRIPPG